MNEIFKNFTAWFWPFIVNLFASIGDFLGDIGMSLYENSNTILPVLGYMLVCAVVLFGLFKLLQYIVNFFTNLTKQSVFKTAIRILIGIVALFLLSSLAIYVRDIT